MRLIDLDDDRHCYVGNDGEYERWNIDPDAPTIDPGKHGKWIRGGEGDDIWLCSECESIFNCRMKYCGNCGAKMDEVER